MIGGGEATVERVRQLHGSVRAVIGECMEAVSAELTFFTLPNCFELFGFDLLVDEDWHLWLLEANAEPDFLQVPRCRGRGFMRSPAGLAPPHGDTTSVLRFLVLTSICT